MRLLIKDKNLELIDKLSRVLTSQGIVNKVEASVSKDWGDEDYGTQNFTLWIEDEDTYERALEIQEEFFENPNNPKFETPNNLFDSDVPLNEKIIKLIPDPPKIIPKTNGFITRNIILLCTLIYILINFTSPPLQINVPAMPTVFFNSPIEREWAFDYPKASELFTEFITLFGDKPANEIPPEGVKLYNESMRTPYWTGFYDKLVNYFQNGVPIQITAPLFEKIQNGQIWRLVTPIFLHATLLHLLFNMLWLLVLGKQIEIMIGGYKYILFIILAAIFSNTAQYLMSGAAFVGYSGVIAAYITFIGTRQEIAPWEGYQLEKMVYKFLLIYIFGIFALQLAAFFIQVLSGKSFSFGIANTAHISGAIFGWIAGRMPFFAWKE